jgi:hypothetical protein
VRYVFYFQHLRKERLTHNQISNVFQPQLVEKQRSSSAEPDSRLRQTQTDVPTSGTGAKHHSSSTSALIYKEILRSPKSPPPQSLYFDDNRIHGDQSFHGYTYQGYGVTAPSFNHYGVPHHPMYFDHIHGLATPAHITHGPPPMMGHPAMDAALATAYVNQAQSNVPPSAASPPGSYSIPAASLWCATQLSPEPILHDKSFQAPQGSPFTFRPTRSSTLYTNRHAHRGAKSNHIGRHSLPAQTGCHSTLSSSPDPASPSLSVSFGAPPNYIPPIVPDKNQLDIDAIASGVDTRTTVMIKNIPNKMTDHDLLDFINRPGVCPRRFDFFYLRMDFTNGGLF